MGFELFTEVAERLESSAQSIRAADSLQKEVTSHRLNSLEPLASALERIGRLLRDGKISSATDESYRLLVAVDRAAVLDPRGFERSEIARVLGKIRTERKSEAARKIGAQGGRPRNDGLPLRRKKLVL